MDLAQQRQQAHAYLDQLPPAQLGAVRTLLESMIHPLGTALHKLAGKDQDLNEEENESVTRSLQWLAQNRSIPLETILADSGMSLADFERLTHRAAKSKTSGHK